ncbi:T9SS type A sorting domain-containing protein, partial [bacterium BMS3Abin03]|nr:T9SS type A sorting domain-containing protein [bacterium BMS3Abin03]
TDRVLPVELTTFTADINNNFIQLNWQTSTEVKNYGFEVERASIAQNLSHYHIDWQKIGFVLGAGNSNSPKSYTFIDKNIIPGVYLYRLKQIDTDGSYIYSKEIEINLVNSFEFKLKQNYPNPFNAITIIKYSIPEASIVRMKIFDILGREIITLVNENKIGGNYEIRFDAKNLSSGIYYYQIRAGKFIDTKKFVLIK